jgi:hypothetical protein
MSSKYNTKNANQYWKKHSKSRKLKHLLSMENQVWNRFKPKTWYSYLLICNTLITIYLSQILNIKALSNILKDSSLQNYNSSIFRLRQTSFPDKYPYKKAHHSFEQIRVNCLNFF